MRHENFKLIFIKWESFLCRDFPPPKNANDERKKFKPPTPSLFRRGCFHENALIN